MILDAPALLTLSRPLCLLLAALTYVLGASVSVYLGKSLDSLVFLLGLFFVVFAQLGMSLLVEVFRPHNEPLIENETPLQKETLRNAALYIFIATFAANAVIVFLLYARQTLSLSSFFFFLSSFLLVFIYAVPPIRLLRRGFGELTLAAHLAYVVPSIGFLLQAKENHRLLVIVAVPLTALALAYFLILNFTTFLADKKYQRATLLHRLTWERAVPLHNSLIIFAYAFFVVALFFGFSILWRALLSLPFAILQIALLRHIAFGGKPHWALLSAVALASFGFTAYFLTLTFWLR